MLLNFDLGEKSLQSQSSMNADVRVLEERIFQIVHAKCNDDDDDFNVILTKRLSDVKI